MCVLGCNRCVCVCLQCTSGFINDGDQLKVTCLSCHKSFCAKCKKAVSWALQKTFSPSSQIFFVVIGAEGVVSVLQWEPQHQDVSCEQFQQWKRDNDPEYQKQGLAGYLRDNGISECLPESSSPLQHTYLDSETTSVVPAVRGTRVKKLFKEGPETGRRGLK